MTTTPFALLTLSFALGLRHALETDHLAAVAAMASERRGMWSSSIVGALWGVGHTAALVAVAATVIVFRVHVPAWLASSLELGVALMLVGLGARLLWTLRAGGIVHFHPHAHGARVHVHPHVHGHEAAHSHAHPEAREPHHGVRRWRRPMLIGVAHGMAGSAGLMVVVLATIPSPVLALAYVGIFGAGTVAGMVLMSALVGMPLALAATRFTRLATAWRVGAALASVVVGLALLWQVGVGRGLWT